MPKLTNEEHEHYVYLYRNKQGNPIYVGYGRYASRSSAHLGCHAHNAELTKRLDRGYTLEIAGPFGNKKTAMAVETSLISALSPSGMLANINCGHRGWRFRAMGMPPKFINRIDEKMLGLEELHNLCAKTNGILFVIINDKQLADGRDGNVLANTPSDTKIAERMDRWWQLYGFAKRNWVPHPEKSPGLLVALGGTGDFRLVVGSLAIDQTGWKGAVEGRERGGLLTVPHFKKLEQLDAQRLRGRMLDPSTKLRFGALRHQSFILLNAHGQWVAGGNKSLRSKPTTEAGQT